MRNRNFIFTTLVLALSGCGTLTPEAIVLNDLHSRLNVTVVSELFYPKDIKEVVSTIKHAKRQQKAISISGGRHAMGGQQFGEGTLHISMKEMNDVLNFDREKGIVRVEAGIEWPELIDYLIETQKDAWPQWGIVQKQTGANRLSIGGALSANVHGRGVKFKPIVQDVESFTLVNADGNIMNVSRQENPELFQLVIGGYGLFGVIATVDLRLQQRFKVERVVEVIPIEELPEKARKRLEDGFLYGDFQYKTDENAEDFMRVGVFSTYKPVPLDTPIPEKKPSLEYERWNKLVLLAHTDKKEAFKFYSQYYLSTNGQVYWSDSHQLGFYDEKYIEFLKDNDPNYTEGSLMITEAYVPRERINVFIEKIADDAKTYDFNIIYGTMRLIEQDDESFLAWAKENYACVIFNLWVEHTEEGLDKAKKNFQRIIDRAIELGGSYFLTYHRWARKDQVLKAYPRFPEFLKLKLKYDPEERFQSDWYRHYKKMFAEEIADISRQ